MTRASLLILLVTNRSHLILQRNLLVLRLLQLLLKRGELVHQVLCERNGKGHAGWFTGVGFLRTGKLFLGRGRFLLHEPGFVAAEKEPISLTRTLKKRETRQARGAWFYYPFSSITFNMACFSPRSAIACARVDSASARAALFGPTTFATRLYTTIA